MKRSALVALMVVVPLAVVAAQIDAHAAVSAADRVASEITWDKGIAVALDRVLADSAVLLWPGAPVLQGKVGINRFLGAQAGALAATRLMWQPLHLELSASGDLALAWGVMTASRPATIAAAAAIPRIGRYMAVWRRQDGVGWRLAVLAPMSVLAATETAWHDSLGPRELPDLLGSPAPIPGHSADRALAVTDSTFAADAGRNRAAAAFGKWAAPDAVSFAGSGELNLGPERIRAAIAAIGDAEWRWAPVIAGASNDGALGYTVGQATITTRDSSGKVETSKSKYVTFWRRMPNGAIRFIADGGNSRP